MINPGTLPVDDATEAAAAANMIDFVAAVIERGGQLAGDPIRDSAADRDGRFGYLLPAAGRPPIPILMPGVPLARVRDLAATAPCLSVEGHPWWWNDAAGQVAGGSQGSASGDLQDDGR